jgi:hypothetical protein
MTDGQYVVQALESGDPIDWEEKKPTAPAGARTIRARAAEAAEGTEVSISVFELESFKEELRAWRTKRDRYEENMIKAFGILWGQCSLGVQTKIEARRDWRQTKASRDAIELLKAIKEVAQDYQDTKYPIAAITTSILAVMTIKQREGESLSAYTQRFKSVVEHMENQYGKFTMQAYVPKMEGYTQQCHQEFQDKAYNRFLAHRFVEGCLKSEALLKQLSNAFAMGNNNYPIDLNTAVSLVHSYRVPVSEQKHNKTKNEEKTQTEVGFAQKGNRKGGKQDKVPAHIKCFNCGENHWLKDCPKKREQGSSNAQTNDEIKSNTGEAAMPKEDRSDGTKGGSAT